MASSAQMEKRRAANWYRWLWLSPLLTIPSLVVLYGFAEDRARLLYCGETWWENWPRGCAFGAVERMAILIAVLGSAVWHLMLLIPAFKDKSEFVRWHGRQALLLAGLRTALPLLLGLAFRVGGMCVSFLALIFVWIGGTRWGQRQATRGDCTLMRWFGRVEALPPPEPALVPDQAKKLDVEALVDIIRYSRDAEERADALLELEKLGMVEWL